MCLAAVEVIGTVPYCIQLIVVNRLGDYRRWVSWQKTHVFFDRVDQYPSILWRASPRGEVQLELARWTPIICAFIFFIFFGFADEARNHYRLAIYSIGKTLGISSFSSAGTSSGGVLTSEVVFKSKSGSSGRIRPGIPVNVHKELFNSRSSIVSVDATFKDVGGLLSEKKGR